MFLSLILKKHQEFHATTDNDFGRDVGSYHETPEIYPSLALPSDTLVIFNKIFLFVKEGWVIH